LDFAGQIAFLDDLLLTAVATEFPDPLTETERASVSAYLVLTHACIEEFLEDAMGRHFECLTAFLASPIVPRAAGAVLLTIGLELDPQKFPVKGRNLKAAVGRGTRWYKGLIRANNGIRYDNLKRLVAGLGTDWSVFEQALAVELADLDALGSKRGEVGHLSPFSAKSVQVTPRIYPEDVRGWVANARVAALAIERYLVEEVQDQMSTLAKLGMAT
jgi:hypothetical protein